jgi:hypothetical protein
MSSHAELPEANRGGSSWFESRLALDLLSVFLGMPIGSILLVIVYGPAIEPGLTISGPFVPVPAVLAIFLGAAAFRLAFAARRRKGFVVALSIDITILIGASVALGIFLHRDFFTATFQYLLGGLIALMFRLSTRPRESLGAKSSSLKAISLAGVVVSAFYVEWIMIMGYAISTRAEPRPIESVLYNVYGLAQVIALFFASRWVERSTFHAVKVGREFLEVDGRDIVSVLGQKKAEIFRLFALSPGRSLSCSKIQELFVEDKPELPSGRCTACTEQTTKVALCARYRNTYNCILELKRVLEFLEIGTITAPENKRRILSDGWKLALFENVRIVVLKK